MERPPRDFRRAISRRNQLWVWTVAIAVGLGCFVLVPFGEGVTGGLVRFVFGGFAGLAVELVVFWLIDRLAFTSYYEDRAVIAEKGRDEAKEELARWQHHHTDEMRQIQSEKADLERHLDERSAGGLDVSFRCRRDTKDLEVGMISVVNVGETSARIQGFAEWRGEKYSLAWHLSTGVATTVVPHGEDSADLLFRHDRGVKLHYYASPAQGGKSRPIEFQKGITGDADGYATDDPLPETVKVTVVSDATSEPIVKRLTVLPSRMWED